MKTDFCAGSLVSADNETYCRQQAGVTTANPIHALSTRYLIAYYVDADTQATSRARRGTCAHAKQK